MAFALFVVRAGNCHAFTVGFRSRLVKSQYPCSDRLHSKKVKICINTQTFFVDEVAGRIGEY